jgi:hypothetical protein
MKRRTDKSIIDEAISFLDHSPELLKNDAIIEYIAIHYDREVSKQQVQKYLGRFIDRCQKHYPPSALKTAQKLLNECSGNLDISQQLLNKVFYTKDN